MPPATSTDGLRFGGFAVDARRRTLYKHGVRVKLHGQPFEVLLLLIERPGEVISREQLQQKLWSSDTFVDFENGLNAAVKKLRQALGDSAEEPRYIETVPRIGYRFIARVQLITEPIGATATRPSANGSPRPTAGIAQIDNGAPSTNGQPVFGLTPDVVLELEPQRSEQDSAAFRSPRVVTPTSVCMAPPVAAFRGKSKTAARRTVAALTACLIVAVVMFIALRVNPASSAPHVTRIRQVTDIGTVAPSQNIAVVGSQVYFAVSEKNDIQIRSVSPDSGTISQIARPFPAAMVVLHDARPSRNELLFGRFDVGFPGPAHTFWELPVPSGIPRQISNTLVDDAEWCPDERTLAYTNEKEQTINLMDGNGRNRRKLASLPGIPFRPRWSPDGKLIYFSVLDSNVGGISIWQIDVSGEHLKPLRWGWTDSSRAWTGRWTPDGRYFLFTGSQDGPRNIWALRERKEILGESSGPPVRLTEGPLSYSMATTGLDGRTIYAVGTQRRGQLMRYDVRTQQFESYQADISGDQVVFSPDDNWLAYIAYPDRTLVRSRVDGSERLQLTFPPMGAFKPCWSPDGAWIAFSAYPAPGKPNKIFIVSARGGPARLLAPGVGTEQDAPTWAADGRFILFSASDESGRWTVHGSNLKTGTDEVLPTPPGFLAVHTSPDGRFIAGLAASTGLVLYDTASNVSRVLARVADYPVWSADGKYIYYNNLMQAATVGTEQVGIFRVAIADGKTERLTGSPNFTLAGNWGVWTGLAPDGSILLLRETGTSDIYALDVDFP